MTQITCFVFNPFEENTYLLYDETGECVIIDPGCFSREEQQKLVDFVTQNKLRPVRLLNTHCHLDHVFGNQFVAETYQLLPELHEGELPVLAAFVGIARQYGLPVREPSPLPNHFIADGDEIKFGNTVLKALLTPGHSPASLSFYCEAQQFVIAGDVLFRGSIGRTDLPGGNHKELLRSIKNKIFPLGDATKVYAGHGESTNIGEERTTNPFLTR